jgi:flagellar assembly factor FliW
MTHMLTHYWTSIAFDHNIYTFETHFMLLTDVNTAVTTYVNTKRSAFVLKINGGTIFNPYCFRDNYW